MSYERPWFKAVSSPLALELATYYPKAFILLWVIFSRAQVRGISSLTGLRPGQAYIGDCDAIGLTEKEYRVAKEVLTRGGLATFKGTNKGTVATITSSEVFILGLMEKGELKGEQRADQGRAEGQAEGGLGADQGRLPKNEEEEEEKNTCRVGTRRDSGLDQAREVLDYLNAAAGRQFRPTDENLKLIAARLQGEGVTLDGVKAMIDRMVKRWTGTEWAEYLQPTTLFGKQKFGGYYDTRELPIQTAATPPQRVNRNEGTMNKGLSHLYAHIGKGKTIHG